MIVLAEFEANKPISDADKKLEVKKVEKVRTRIGFIKEKANDMKSTVLKLKPVKEMTENEVKRIYDGSEGLEISS